MKPYTVIYLSEDLEIVMDHVEAETPQKAVEESGYENTEADSDVVVIESHVFDVLAGNREEKADEH